MAEVFSRHGYRCLPVGGALRDILLDRTVGDFDLATDAHPEEVIRIFPHARVVPTGLKHGTVTLVGRDRAYEITTFRTESGYADHRHPDAVGFTTSLEDDLSRRDFTVNALALDLSTGVLSDLFDGLGDIADKTLRTIGDPGERFREDALRMMRCCRFAATLGFRIEERTFDAIRENASLLSQVSQERIRDELLKIIGSPQPSIGFEAMRRTGLLALVLPELLEGFEMQQNKYHRFDVYTHNIRSCDAAAGLTDDLAVRMAALLHDTGKARTIRPEPDGENTFYNHEIVGASMAWQILRRLRCSNAFTEKVCRLVKNHMFHYTELWTDSAVRRFMRKTEDIMDEIFALREADRIGSGKRTGPSRILEDLKVKIEHERKAQSAFKITDLALGGNDIMRILSIPPSPRVGRVLAELLEQVLENPDLNTPERLEELIRKMPDPTGSGR